MKLQRYRLRHLCQLGGIHVIRCGCQGDLYDSEWNEGNGGLEIVFSLTGLLLVTGNGRSCIRKGARVRARVSGPYPPVCITSCSFTLSSTLALARRLSSLRRTGHILYYITNGVVL